MTIYTAVGEIDHPERLAPMDFRDSSDRHLPSELFHPNLGSVDIPHKISLLTTDDLTRT
jgi:hypothetical protein